MVGQGKGEPRTGRAKDVSPNASESEWEDRDDQPPPGTEHRSSHPILTPATDAEVDMTDVDTGDRQSSGRTRHRVRRRRESGHRPVRERDPSARPETRRNQSPETRRSRSPLRRPRTDTRRRARSYSPSPTRRRLKGKQAVKGKGVGSKATKGKSKDVIRVKGKFDKPRKSGKGSSSQFVDNPDDLSYDVQAFHENMSEVPLPLDHDAPVSKSGPNA